MNQVVLFCAHLRLVIFGMTYVIRAADKVGNVAYIQPMNERGHRTLGERSTAEAFPDAESAENAVMRMPPIFADMGLEYTVEDRDAGN